MSNKVNEITRIDVVQRAIDKLKAKRYLEVGVHSGGCFLTIKAPKKIAVDPFFQISKRNKKNAWRADWRNLKNSYYEMTSDAFFETKKSVVEKGFDVVLLDGLHTYEQTLKDVENALPYLSEKGVIVLHDCFPPHEGAAFSAPSLEAANAANPPGWTGEWCGDVWKVIVNLRSLRKDVRAFVLNTDKGLGIVTKGTPKEFLDYTVEKIDELTYKDLISDPEHYIGLKEISTLDDFINGLN